jgi:uncharacterized protein YrrD
MPDPVSWKAVEKGWPVYAGDGQQIGTVHEIAGDEEADIFDGFGVRMHALGHVKYVPAEIVASIAEGEVRLSTPADTTFDDLNPEIEEQIIPEGSTWYQRLAWWLTGRDR